MHSNCHCARSTVQIDFTRYKSTEAVETSEMHALPIAQKIPSTDVVALTKVWSNYVMCSGQYLELFVPQLMSSSTKCGRYVRNHCMNRSDLLVLLNQIWPGCCCFLNPASRVTFWVEKSGGFWGFQVYPHPQLSCATRPIIIPIIYQFRFRGYSY
jgi:hypothetical protein